jgi:predicted molibdopterin-dependent oxidoreductase YjgC
MSEIQISIDGTSIAVPAGLSIAAALMSADLISWRETRINAEARGVFCGIGACFDCLVTVNGQRNIRACLEQVRDGDVITTGSHHEN